MVHKPIIIKKQNAFSVTTQTLYFNDNDNVLYSPFFNTPCQYCYIKLNINNKHTQTDNNIIHLNKSNNCQDNDRNKFLYSLQLRNSIMSKIYESNRIYSPMATLLSIMGKLV